VPISQSSYSACTALLPMTRHVTRTRVRTTDRVSKPIAGAVFGSALSGFSPFAELRPAVLSGLAAVQASKRRSALWMAVQASTAATVACRGFVRPGDAFNRARK